MIYVGRVNIYLILQVKYFNNNDRTFVDHEVYIAR